MLPYWFIPFNQIIPSPDIIHQHIETALLSLDARHQRLHLFRIQMINLQSDSLPSRLLDHLSRFLDRLRPVHL
jgi:hypothetical protein